MGWRSRVIGEGSGVSRGRLGYGSSVDSGACSKEIMIMKRRTCLAVPAGLDSKILRSWLRMVVGFGDAISGDDPSRIDGGTKIKGADFV